VPHKYLILINSSNNINRTAFSRFLRKGMLTEKNLSAVIVVFMISTIEILSGGYISNATASENQTVTVSAGGGNSTAPWTIFVPQEIKIDVGDTVVWDNPTEGAAEPHTVTLVLDNNTMAGVVSPLGVSNTTEFIVNPPGSNNEPILLPGENGTNTLIAVNARTFNPTVIDPQGDIQFMQPNANYSMTGDEKYINSG
jgi:plastocyanin